MKFKPTGGHHGGPPRPLQFLGVSPSEDPFLLPGGLDGASLRDKAARGRDPAGPPPSQRQMFSPQVDGARFWRGKRNGSSTSRRDSCQRRDSCPHAGLSSRGTPAGASPERPDLRARNGTVNRPRDPFVTLSAQTNGRVKRKSQYGRETRLAADWLLALLLHWHRPPNGAF